MFYTIEEFSLRIFRTLISMMTMVIVSTSALSENTIAYDAVENSINDSIDLKRFYDWPGYLQWKVVDFSNGDSLFFSANRRYAIKGNFVVLDLWLDKKVDLETMHKNLDYFPIQELLGDNSLEFVEFKIGAGEKDVFVLGEAFSDSLTRVIGQITPKLMTDFTFHIIPMRNSSNGDAALAEANIYRIGCSLDTKKVIEALSINSPKQLEKTKLSKSCIDEMNMSQLNIFKIISSYVMPYLPFVWREWDQSGVAIVGEDLQEFVTSKDRTYD